MKKYENIKMYHRDGTLMAMTSLHRAKWYVSHGLAMFINDHAFKLTFDPIGYGRFNNEFFTSGLKDQCVVCGASEGIEKFRIIPYMFLKLLPVFNKTHSNHDVLFLCRSCCSKCDSAYNDIIDSVLKHYGSSRKEISHNGLMNHKIKQARKILHQYNSGCFGKNAIIPQDRINALEKIAESNVDMDASKWEQAFIDDMMDNNVRHELFVKFRSYFLDIMHPEFMPVGWDVNFNQNS